MQHPSIKPILFFHLDAEEPEQIFSTKSSSLTNVKVKSGYVKSLDESKPFEAKVVRGSDDISFDPANPATGHLDCRLYLSIDGVTKGFVQYSGVVQFEGKVAEVVGKQTSHMEFSEGYVTCHPRIHLDDSVTEFKWLEDINYIGKGRFIRDEEGGLKVQYYVYTFDTSKL
ncbi:hypothetical protein CANARDRAFT_200641 [[Candida] arabinofermentans NRRL YB-2248]|uniref:Uncharacterized protein n=1 Tax=[Candida] arabinofermentans NRRL YB-2248 TaxID=983967 RepID=A0A1E4SYR1_9ASCO|nr:hypothetical protein CANARDRAFT_200641 [[Candida] arabinofermentans NRRL YB-2248]